MIATTTKLGFQKLAGFFYSGLGATYTTTVTPGTGVIDNFRVMKRPISATTANVAGIGGTSGSVEFTEENDVEFELEVWGDVTTIGTFTITSTSTGEEQGSALASYATDADGNVIGLTLPDGATMNLNLLSDTKYPAQISRYPFTPARVIAHSQDGLSVAGGWSITNGTLSAVTDDLPHSNSTQAVKALWAGGGTMSVMHKIPSTVLSGKAEILVKFPKVSSGSAYWYYKWSATAPAADPPTTAPVNTRSINISSSERADGVWTKLSFDPRSNRYSTGQPTGGRAWTSTEALPSNIQYLEIACDFSSTPVAESYILIDHVAINGSTRPMVVLGFDGFYSSIASSALPLFQKYGLKGYNSSSGNHISSNQATCDALYDAGWDLIQQAQRTGNYGTDANGGSLAVDVASAKTQFIANGYTRGADIFIYPYNSRSPSTDAILESNGFKCAVSQNGVSPVSQLKSGSFLSLGRLSINGQTSAQMQAQLDAAILEGSHAWFYGHNLVGTITDASTQTLTSEFTTFMAYVADKHFAGTIDVVTPSEFLSRIDANN